MEKLEKITREIRSFSDSELTAFRKWFYEYDAESWDRQIADDAASGRLDRLAEKALKDFSAGRCREM